MKLSLKTLLLLGLIILPVVLAQGKGNGNNGNGNGNQGDDDNEDENENDDENENEDENEGGNNNGNNGNNFSVVSSLNHQVHSASSTWVTVSLKGKKNSSPLTSVRATLQNLPEGLTVEYPSERDYSSPAKDDTLGPEESDFIAFRVTVADPRERDSSNLKYDLVLTYDKEGESFTYTKQGQIKVRSVSGCQPSVDPLQVESYTDITTYFALTVTSEKEQCVLTNVYAEMEENKEVEFAYPENPNNPSEDASSTSLYDSSTLPGLGSDYIAISSRFTGDDDEAKAKLNIRFDKDSGSGTTKRKYDIKVVNRGAAGPTVARRDGDVSVVSTTIPEIPSGQKTFYYINLLQDGPETAPTVTVPAGSSLSVEVVTSTPRFIVVALTADALPGDMVSKSFSFALSIPGNAADITMTGVIYNRYFTYSGQSVFADVTGATAVNVPISVSEAFEGGNVVVSLENAADFGITEYSFDAESYAVLDTATQIPVWLTLGASGTPEAATSGDLQLKLTATVDGKVSATQVRVPMEIVPPTTADAETTPGGAEGDVTGNRDGPASFTAPSVLFSAVLVFLSLFLA